MYSNHRRFLFVVFLTLFGVVGFAQKNGYTLNVSVTEKGSREAIIMATLQLQPSGAMAVTDMNGKATINNIPSGEYTLQISYVGFEPISTRLKITKDMQMQFQMTPSSLSLREVQVVAKQRESGASTSNVIGRQAIDHLQATSLADVMQLLPGQLMDRPDLTQQQGLQLRTLQNNSTMAFGTSIVVDGVPMSNNGDVGQGAFSGTAFAGSDLRQISADNIEEVEVIRGIPSAEYGDLTSGLVVVHSKVGVTPWQVKAKINPGLQNYSMGKGFLLNKTTVVNANLDYAKAWGDPRQKTRSYDRYTFNLGWGYDLDERWHIENKFRFMQAKDWSGQDPDAIQDGTESESKTTTFGLTHNGRIRMDMPLMRTLKYTLGVSMSQINNENTSFVAVSSGLLPILTARKTGYYNVNFVTSSYKATGITNSRPGNVFFKLTDDFFLRLGKTIQSFKIGVDYRYDWNTGRGYYNLDETRPYRPNSNGRPRAFDDIPGLHQLSIFAEDQFTYNINKVNRLRVNFGLRFTSLQPFNEVATTALSPRLNVALSVAKWLDIRGGIGLNSKTPGLMHLYPDKKYIDDLVGNFTMASTPAYYTHTEVYDVQRSKGLKNATTTKVEVGADIKLPEGRKLSILAYQDRTPNGFETASDYFTYTYHLFDDTHMPSIVNGQPDFSTGYAYQFTCFATTGQLTNTDKTINRGLEFDFDLGEIKPLKTNIYLSGAWNETKTNWSTRMNTTSVPASLLTGTIYAGRNISPVRIVYPSGLDYTRLRRFVNTLRAVTHIPQLHMVASFTAQAIWHNSTWSYTADKNPIGWISDDLVYHDINSAEYITFNGGQIATNDEKLQLNYTDNEPTENPITWNLSARLTKELGTTGALSLYVDNCLFYEPYLKGNKTSTLSQRNTGKFAFGAELSLKF
jgi:outer membrane receptor protein involved in Fe transport